MPVTGLYSVGRLVWNFIGGSRLNYYWVVFESHSGRGRSVVLDKPYRDKTEWISLSR